MCGIFLRLLLNLAGNAGGYALAGVIYISVGTKIMQDHHQDGYHMIEGVREAAVGGAVIGAAVAMLKELIHLIQCSCSTDKEWDKGYEHTAGKILFEVLAGIGLMCAAAALGTEMLRSYSNQDSAQHAVIAMLIGAGIFALPAALVLCCYWACGIGKKAVPSQAEENGRNNDDNSDGPDRLANFRNSIGKFSLWARGSDATAPVAANAQTPAAASAETPGASADAIPVGAVVVASGPRA